ncbi:hypothetical protein, partial [Brucella intermedia]|uniref:hypothetical protein n=1 Tax=Brucella intermedia TaxID=94625 RepID=UPI001AEEBA4D
PPGDIVHGFSNNGANCLFIFFKAVIKFHHLLRLGAFEGDTPPQRARPLRGGFFLATQKCISALQACPL